MIILYTYIFIILVAILVTVIMTQRTQNSRRITTDKATRRRVFYIRQVVNLLQDESRIPMNIIARTRSERIALCEAIHIVRSHTYGTDSRH